VPAGISINPNAGILSGTPTQPGAFSFSVRATDSLGHFDSTTVSGTIALPLTFSCNQNTGPTQVGVAYSNRCLAIGGTPPYTVGLVGLLPPGLSALQDGSSVTVSGTPTQAVAYNFSARVQDAAFHTVTRDFGGTIAAAAPLSITCTPATGPTQVGVAYSSTCTAAGGTPPYSYGLAGQGVPAGIDLSAAGVLSGTPTQVGAYSFGVLATDAANQTVSKTFSGTITAAANCTPVFPYTLAAPYYVTPPGGQQGFGVDLPASCQWTASTTTPWLSIVPGPASGSGNVSVTFTSAANNTGSTRTGSFVINGATLLVAQISLVSLTCNPNTGPTQVGVAYSTTCTAGGGVPPYQYFTQSTLPAGLTFVNGTLSGTPTQAGAYNFTLRAADSFASTGGQVFSGTISPAGPLPLTITCTPSTGPTQVGVAYSSTCTASGGTAPYTYSLVPTLPAGLTMANGVVGGTPLSAGAYSFGVTATDAASASATKTFTGTIVAAGAPLSITCTPSTGPAKVGTAFSSFCAVAGGVPGYTFSTVGQLPTGVTFSLAGFLSGTPTQSGAYNFGIRVTDAANQTATQTFTGTIAPADPAALSITCNPSSGPTQVGTAYSTTCSASGGTAPYGYTTTGTVPTGLVLVNGTLSGTPTQAGAYSFGIRTTDAVNQTAEQAFSGTITAAGACTPVFGFPVSAQVGFPAQGGAGGILVTLPAGCPWTATSNTSWLTVAAGSASGTGTATVFFDGTANTTNASRTGTVIIAGVTIQVFQPVVLTLTCTSGTGPAKVGVLYSTKCAAAGGFTPYVYSTTGTVPAGLALSASGVLIGTPTQAGEYSFSLRVTDAANATAAQAFTGTIAAAGPAPLTLTCNPSTGPTQAGVPYSTTCTSTGGVFPYSVGNGAFPAGLALSGLSSVSGGVTFTIGGTPRGAGAYSFFAEARDGSTPPLTALKTFTGSMAPATGCTPSITPSGPIAIPRDGGTLVLQLAVEASCGWTATSNQTWANISPASASGTGSAQITVSAGSNRTGALQSAVLNIAGTEVNVTQDMALIITCAPEAGPTTIGVFFTSTCTAVGGVPPYSIVREGGPVPAGMTLSQVTPATAVFSGTPTQPGSYTFNVVVRDSATPLGNESATFRGTLTTAPISIATVRSAGEFGGFAALSSGTYIEIVGTGLSNTTRIWEGRDFTGNGLLAPTVVDNVRVTVNGIAAFLYYVSPTQLNVVTPADVTTGSVEIKVTNPAGQTATAQIQKFGATPGLLLPAQFKVDGKQYLAAQFPDLVFVGRTGSVPGVAMRPVKPGETITAYGLGFGDVAPYFAPGSVVTQINNLVLPLTVSFGATPATVTYKGLSPNYVNLYQFNITVPTTLPADGDYQINVTLGGQPLQQPAFYLTVQR